MTEKDKLVEIARSFAFKLNAGNYQSADFFCSQKEECKIEDAEEVSNRLFHFCKQMVEKDVEKYKEVNTPESEKVIDVNAEHPF